MQRGRYRTGLPEAKFGIPATVVRAESVLACAGLRQTELMATTARSLSADDAVAAGLIDEAVDTPEEVMSRCREVLLELLEADPTARAATKAMLREPALARFNAEREESAKRMLRIVQDERVQQLLGMYIASLKKS